MITETAIQAVRDTIADAEAIIDQVRPKAWRSRGAAQTLAGARAHHAAASEELERLEAQYAAEQQAIKDRPKVEKANKALIDAAADELTANEKQLTEAVNGALALLGEICDLSTARNEIIARRAAELATAGLQIRDGENHTTGGARTAVRVRGRWFLPVDGGQLALWTVRRVAVARLPRHHGVHAGLLFWPGMVGLDRRGDQLVAKVATVKPVKHTPLRAHVQPLAKAPVGLHEYQREQAARDREVTWTPYDPDRRR